MKQQERRAVYLLFAFGILSHITSIANGFASDDLIHILSNHSIRSISGSLSAFIEPIYPGNLYRPLLYLSYGLNFMIGGENPVIYHLTNVLLHGANTALCFLLLFKLLEFRKAFLATFLFSAFSIHSETVANISGRAELLGAFWILSALIIAVRACEGASRSLVSSSICCLFASLSKESAFIIPILFLLIGYKLKIERGRVIAVLLALVSVIAASLCLRSAIVPFAPGETTVLNVTDNPLLALPTAGRRLGALVLLGNYIFQTLLPFGIGSDYSYSTALNLVSTLSFSAPRLFILVLSACLIFIPHRGRNLKFGMLWFFTAFLVTSNVLFPIGTAYGERLAYLPSIGIAVALAEISLPTIFFIAAGLAYLTVNTTADRYWRDNDSLSRRNIQTSPDSVKANLNYAVSLRNSEDLEGAVHYAKEALEILPQSPEAAVVMASIYVKKDLISGAEHYLHQALTFNPHHVPALQTLGRLYLNTGRAELAEAKFQEVLKTTPDNTEALRGLAGSELNLGKIKEAKVLLLKSLNLDPTSSEGRALLSKLPEQD